MANESTSKRVASIAGRYAGMSFNKFQDALHHQADGYEKVFADVVSMASSLINQASDKPSGLLRVFSEKHDGSEVGEFQTYVKRRSSKKKAKR